MKRLFLAAAIGLAVSGAALADPGRLVIAGGALEGDNAAVFDAFIDAAGGPDARFAILPTASGYPSGSAQDFAEALANYGVDPANIVRVDLAVENDPDTERVDESRWADNADDPEEIAKIETAGGIWFTGGDQARIAQALIEDDGSDTPMLAALGFGLGTGGTALIQRSYSADSVLKSVLKGLLGGIAVGLPMPIAGTAVGGAVLTLSGLSRLMDRGTRGDRSLPEEDTPS